MSAASEQAADLEGDNVLDLRGSRGIVDEAKAKELMSAVAERQTAFDTAVLSTRSITPPASCIVAEELAKLPLRRAIFSDCISGIPEKDAFETLNVLCAALKGKVRPARPATAHTVACCRLFTFLPPLRGARTWRSWT